LSLPSARRLFLLTVRRAMRVSLGAGGQHSVARRGEPPLGVQWFSSCAAWLLCCHPMEGWIHGRLGRAGGGIGAGGIHFRAVRQIETQSDDADAKADKDQRAGR
jgi:hypothetical protein